MEDVGSEWLWHFSLSEQLKKKKNLHKYTRGHIERVSWKKSFSVESKRRKHQYVVRFWKNIRTFFSAATKHSLSLPIFVRPILSLSLYPSDYPSLSLSPSHSLSLYPSLLLYLSLGLCNICYFSITTFSL